MWSLWKMPLTNCLDKEKSLLPPLFIEVAGRASPLSKVQIQEVLLELNQFHPHIHFNIQYLLTCGDLDQKTSLRDLGRTNFFTKEIDQLILDGKCRIGIHSAKDLPEPLHPELSLLCLTKGVDSADVLVLRQNESLETLPKGACIATSSYKREENVRLLRSDLTFKDIRGTVDDRLAFLESKHADGLVVAEAALIRLGLTHLNRIRLPGETTRHQGRLAVVGRVSDHEMRCFFASLDVRNQIIK